MNPWAIEIGPASVLSGLLADVAPPLETMDPVLRARVLMMIMGLIILGAALLLFVALGARWARKMIRHKASAPRPPIEDKWYARPLVPPDGEPDESSPDKPQQPGIE